MEEWVEEEQEEGREWMEGEWEKEEERGREW